MLLSDEFQAQQMGPADIVFSSLVWLSDHKHNAGQVNPGGQAGVWALEAITALSFHQKGAKEDQFSLSFSLDIATHPTPQPDHSFLGSLLLPR